jgi:hypothetical protein
MRGFMKRLAHIKYNLYGESKDYQTDVIHKENMITYFDDGVKTIIDLKNGIINRENDEYQYVIDLSKYHINIHLNKENVDLEIRVNILEKKYNLEHLYIKYLLVDENITNEFEIKL